MKPLLAFLLVAIGFLVMPGLSFGQTSLIVDPAIQQVVTDALPAKFASYGTAIILGIMIIGRGLTALANGRGIKGWLSAIINGTNGPRILIATLCLLTLPACTVDWQRAATAAANASAPIILEGINAKQPRKSVQP